MLEADMAVFIQPWTTIGQSSPIVTIDTRVPPCVVRGERVVFTIERSVGI